VTGGDDYELVFAAAPQDHDRVLAAAGGTPVTCIGRFTAGPPAVRLLDAHGGDITPQRLGWSHR
jgi:thiamine-monophosphate kinase